MNDTERSTLIDELNRSRDRLRRATATLTAAQWHFHAAADCWNIAEIMEHLVLVEGGLRGRVEKRLADPPDPEQRPLTAGKDAMIPVAIPDRTTRREAPESVIPSGRWESDQVFDEFRAAREKTILVAGDRRYDLRDYIFPHARLGELDCYQWLLFISAHAERHLRQIEEIQAHADYPATR